MTSVDGVNSLGESINQNGKTLIDAIVNVSKTPIGVTVQRNKIDIYCYITEPFSTKKNKTKNKHFQQTASQVIT